MIEQPGILGTGASLASDLSLLAYVFLIVPTIFLGFMFARRKMFIPHHKLIMTSIVIVNWAIILYLMLYSYREGVAPRVPRDISDPLVLIPTIHLITGGIAQLLATYLVIRMWLENVLPSFLMVKRIKRYMRLTMALWLFTAALGVVIYIMFYTSPALTPDAQENVPVATEEVNAPEGTPPPVLVDNVNDSDQAAATLDPVSTEEVSGTTVDTTGTAPRPLVLNIVLVSPITLVLPEGLFGGLGQDDALAPVATEDVSVPAPVETLEVPAPATTEEFFDDDDDDRDDDRDDSRDDSRDDDDNRDDDNSGMGGD